MWRSPRPFYKVDITQAYQGDLDAAMPRQKREVIFGASVPEPD